MRINFFLLIIVIGVQVVFAATQTVAVLPSEGVLNDEELEYLTDKAQEIAVRVLPKSSFEVFPQEVIIKRLGGADNYVKECKESSCIVDLGKKAMVDYVAQCRFGKLGSDLRVTFELYKVSTSGLIDKFSESAKNVDGLLAIMQEKIPDGFMKIPGASSRGKAVLPPVAGGIRDLERAVDYELGYGKYYIANIATEPQGAALSFDGLPDDRCNKTPCETELSEGEVRIIAKLEQYETADTTISIKENNQNISIALKPNFGVLEINPAYSGGIRNWLWNLEINNKSYPLGKIRLSPGNYEGKLSHECYENIGFKVGINKGSRDVIDMDTLIVLKKGGLVLSAEKDGKPVSEPVFVNGKPVGETPFSGSVAICSDIEIGFGKEKVDVELKYNEKVKHKHTMRTEPEYEPPPYTSYNFPQVRNRTPPPYRTTPEYESPPYASSTEDHSYEETVSSITKNDNDNDNDNDIKNKDDDKSVLSLGFRAGFNFSYLYADYNGTTGFYKTSVGLQVGLVLDIALSSWFYIQPGVMYIQKGTEDSYDGMTLHYIEIPLLLSLKYESDKAARKAVRINTGPYFGICVDESSDYIDGGKIDIGINVGLGFEVMIFYIDMFYDIGLTDVGDRRNFELYNYTVGFNFGVNL